MYPTISLRARRHQRIIAQFYFVVVLTITLTSCIGLNALRTLTIDVIGEGTVSSTPEGDNYSTNTSVVVTAEPNEGWEFDHWEGDLTGTNPTAEITMNSDRSITAAFAVLTKPAYSLAVTIQGSGSVNKTPDQSIYSEDVTVILEAIPSSGWWFDHWEEDASGTNASITIIMDAAKSVTAAFVEDAAPAGDVVLEGPTLIMNPTGSTPLAAVVELVTAIPARVDLRITNDTDGWSVAFPGYRQEHRLPVLGLKPDNVYSVQIWLFFESSAQMRLDPDLLAVTDPLPDDFPAVTALVSNPGKMEPGFTLLDRARRLNGEPRASYSMILDKSGEVVWYSERPTSAVRQLPNGNLLFRLRSTIIEMDMLGNDIETVTLGYGHLHHDLFLTVNGTYLSLGAETIEVDDYPTSDTDPSAPTQTAEIRNDLIFEFAADGTILNQWPLSQFLDTGRISYDSLQNLSDGYDWSHSNAVFHDPMDDSIVVSVRHQDAIIKFSRATGKLIWILGPHANWTEEFQPYLLHQVGAPFEWPFHSHAPMYTSNGTLLVFDNGNYRASPFDGTVPLTPAESYSRGVEYAIDEENMEVRQIWEDRIHAAERLHTPSRGDADGMETTGNVLLTFSAISCTGGVPNTETGLPKNYARIVEVDHGTPAEIVFDLQVHDPESETLIIYRSERIPSLYSENHRISRH